MMGKISRGAPPDLTSTSFWNMLPLELKPLAVVAEWTRKMRKIFRLILEMALPKVSLLSFFSLLRSRVRIIQKVYSVVKLGYNKEFGTSNFY
jgi:hypothetical protein